MLGADAFVRAPTSPPTPLPPPRRPWSRRASGAEVLVNNAGTTKFVAAKDLDGLDSDDFQRIYAVNVIGAFQMVRAFAPLLGRARAR